jgi:hypothetical protein
MVLSLKVIIFPFNHKLQYIQKRMGVNTTQRKKDVMEDKKDKEKEILVNTIHLTKVVLLHLIITNHPLLQSTTVGGIKEASSPLTMVLILVPSAMTEMMEVIIIRMAVKSQDFLEAHNKVTIVITVQKVPHQRPLPLHPVHLILVVEEDSQVEVAQVTLITQEVQASVVPIMDHPTALVLHQEDLVLHIIEEEEVGETAALPLTTLINPLVLGLTMENLTWGITVISALISLQEHNKNITQEVKGLPILLITVHNVLQSLWCLDQVVVVSLMVFVGSTRSKTLQKLFSNFVYF